MDRISLLDRNQDTWVQPDPAVDSWSAVGSLVRSDWLRREVELAWGPVTEVIESTGGQL